MDTALEDEIYHALTGLPDTTVDLAHRTRRPLRQVCLALDILVRRGWAERIKAGVYRLSIPAKERLDLAATALEAAADGEFVWSPAPGDLTQ